MKKKKITETYLRNLIRESIRKNLNEISTDTIDSAKDKARKKYNKYRAEYGENDPRTAKAVEQYGKFKANWDTEYSKGNLSRRARLSKNRDDRKSGKRTYQSGKGWRTHNNNEDESKTINEDWKRGYKAAEMSEDFFEYNSALEHAEDLLHDLEDIYSDSDFSRYSSEMDNYNPDNNMRKTIKKFGEQVLQIYKYFKRKRAQKYNLDDLWQDQFEKETGTKVRDAEIDSNTERALGGGKYKIDNINAQRYNPEIDDYEDIG